MHHQFVFSKKYPSNPANIYAHTQVHTLASRKQFQTKYSQKCKQCGKLPQNLCLDPFSFYVVCIFILTRVKNQKTTFSYKIHFQENNKPSHTKTKTIYHYGFLNFICGTSFGTITYKKGRTHQHQAPLPEMEDWSQQ